MAIPKETKVIDKLGVSEENFPDLKAELERLRASIAYRKESVKDDMKAFFNHFKGVFDEMEVNFSGKLNAFVDESLENVDKCKHRLVKLQREWQQVEQSSSSDFYEHRNKYLNDLSVLERDIDKLKKSYNIFSFLPYNIKQFDSIPVAYVRFFEADPKNVVTVACRQDVVDPAKITAYLDKMEIIYIHTEAPYEPNLAKYMSLSVTDPKDERVDLEVTDEEDGSYFVAFTPSIVGLHMLQIKMYSIPIKGSPFQINVIASEEPADRPHEYVRLNAPKLRLMAACVASAESCLRANEVESNTVSSSRYWETRGSNCEGDDETSADDYYCSSEAPQDRSWKGKIEIEERGSGDRSTGRAVCYDDDVIISGNAFRDVDYRTVNEVEEFDARDPRICSSFGSQGSVSRSEHVYSPEIFMIEESSVNSDSIGPVSVIDLYDLKKFNIFRTSYVKTLCLNDKVNFPIGIYALKGHVYVCDTSKGLVKVYLESTDKLVGVLGNKPGDSLFHRPSAVLVKNEKVYVKDDKAIHVYSSITFAFIDTIGAGSLQRPFGLAWSDNDQLLTLDLGGRSMLLCAFDPEDYDAKVKNFNSKFESARTGPMSSVIPLLFDRLMFEESIGSMKVVSKCRFIEYCDGHVYIVDLGKSQVYITDMLGNLVGKFGSFGVHKCGQFKEPSGIAKDSSGNLLIGDSKNNRIQVFNKFGKPLGILDLVERIRRPSDIYLSPENRLYVSNYLNQCVKIYDLLPPIN